MLAGTLVRPTGAGHHPAVVVLGGSGPVDRHGHVRGFPAYSLIAIHLARHGIATLLLDRRGTGGSMGDWAFERIDDRARDARVAVAWLERRDDVDPTRVGLLGHSQGGWVAQLAAAQDPAIDFVVLMAGPAETVRAQILTDAAHEWRGAGVSPAETTRRLRALRWQIALAHAFAPLCRALRVHPVCATVDHDPGPALRALRVPVLALFAELDPMVPPEPNVRLLRAQLAAGHAPPLTVRVFAGANHQFWPATTGTRAEYPRLQPGYVPGVLEAISDWLAAGPPR